jgi:hypothetical protein
MSLNPSPYATVACLNKSIRFFKTDGDHVNAWVAHEDVVAAFGMPEWATRIPPIGPFGCLPGSIFSDNNNTANIAVTMPVIVAGVGWLNCILTTVATTMVANCPVNGSAAQTVQAALLAAITTGQAALP